VPNSIETHTFWTTRNLPAGQMCVSWNWSASPSLRLFPHPGGCLPAVGAVFFIPRHTRSRPVGICRQVKCVCLGIGWHHPACVFSRIQVGVFRLSAPDFLIPRHTRFGPVGMHRQVKCVCLGIGFLELVRISRSAFLSRSGWVSAVTVFFRDYFPNSKIRFPARITPCRERPFWLKIEAICPETFSKV